MTISFMSFPTPAPPLPQQPETKWKLPQEQNSCPLYAKKKKKKVFPLAKSVELRLLYHVTSSLYLGIRMEFAVLDRADLSHQQNSNPEPCPSLRLNSNQPTKSSFLSKYPVK